MAMLFCTLRKQAISYNSWPPLVTAPHLIMVSHLMSPAHGRNIATTHHRRFSIASYASPKTCTPIVEYMPLEDIEKPERYRPGGYHPLSVGDRLNGRYDVVHKLGFGTYSTIWLARDANLKKYVAIKIAIAEADSPESHILDTLAPAPSEPSDEGQPGAEALIPQVLDTFSLDGPNGRHTCLVTEPGIMSLAEAKDASYTRLFTMPVARAIAAQVIQAVAFLHRQGVVHADLHAGNIMFRLSKSVDELSPADIYQRYGPPNIEPFVRSDGKPLPDGVPSHGVVPIWLGKESERVALSEARVFVTDFGESFRPSSTTTAAAAAAAAANQRLYSHTPAVLTPPETYFHEPLSFPSDIWTLACTIWEGLGQRPLFEGFNPSNDWMIKEHVDALGKLPSDWWQAWDARERWFTEEAKRRAAGAGRTLGTRFVDSIQDPRQGSAMEGIGEAEKSALLAMVKGMLAFRPDERLTAMEVLGSGWMRRWGLPALAKVAA